MLIIRGFLEQKQILLRWENNLNIADLHQYIKKKKLLNFQLIAKTLKKLILKEKKFICISLSFYKFLCCSH